MLMWGGHLGNAGSYFERIDWIDSMLSSLTRAKAVYVTNGFAYYIFWWLDDILGEW
jgi:hypothetical protein